MRPYSKKEEKIKQLATIGGLTDEEAFFKVYRPKTRKIGLTQLGTKRRKRPDLFDEIAKYKKELFDAAAAAQREAVKAAATTNALSAIEKRERLRMIIEGEIEEEIIFQYLGKALKVRKVPSLSDRIRAIDLDNKLAGHYPDKGIRHEAGDSFIDFMKAASQARVKKNEGSGEALPSKKEGSSIGNSENNSVTG